MTVLLRYRHAAIIEALECAQIETATYLLESFNVDTTGPVSVQSEKPLCGGDDGVAVGNQSNNSYGCCSDASQWANDMCAVKRLIRAAHKIDSITKRQAFLFILKDFVLDQSCWRGAVIACAMGRKAGVLKDCLFVLEQQPKHDFDRNQKAPWLDDDNLGLQGQVWST